MNLYKIGQLLYIVANKSRTIEPVQIVSKQTMENVQGIEVQHMCENVDGKTFLLEEHNEQKLLAGVFETVEEAESHLLKLAAEMVHNLADAAREKAAVLQAETDAVESPDISSSTDTREGEEIISTVNLPDGTIARARIHYPPDLR